MPPKFTTIQATATTSEDLTPVSASKYDKFPDEVRKRLNRRFRHAASVSSVAALTAPGDEFRQHFCLKKGIIYKWPAKAPEFQQIGGIFRNAVSANVALLDELLKEEDFPLFKKEDWVKLETLVPHLENPEQLQLHMLRRGDFGWGFDAEKCLSVAFVFEWGAENTVEVGELMGDLRMHVYFVQRLRGSGDDGVRDAQEEAVLRAKEAKPTLKFALKRPSQVAAEKKNPLLEAEKEAAERKRAFEDEQWDDDDEDEEDYNSESSENDDINDDGEDEDDVEDSWTY